MTSQRPELETQRAMLTQMRDSFRAQGFEAEMNALVLGVQTANEEGKEDLAKAVAEARTKSENCYRSAEELSVQLSKLPKPKKAK